MKSLGVILTQDGASFNVWAPSPETVELNIIAPEPRIVAMEKNGDYYTAFVPGLKAGAKYYYRLNQSDNRPDPASRHQPDGLQGPSEIVDQSFGWSDNCWCGLPLQSTVLYEMHIGTFTPEGTFEAAIPHLPRLRDLGVTTLNIMPVSQFPGARNWGYDGVLPYAVQNTYGGPNGFKALINAAHALKMAVVLDVVYNHLGPEGNYAAQFGPYFTDCYTTPWGGALNFDRELSDPVREFFLQNAEYWIREYHIDGLRLDAAHFILDNSAKHFLAELKERTEALAYTLDRRIHLFAESDANDTKYLSAAGGGGYGLDCQWLDDFHHSLYTRLPGAGNNRYLPDYDFKWCLPKAYDEGFVYSGQYSPFRKRRHGNSSRACPGSKFVVFIQNHDQVGNKPLGTRLAEELSFENQKVAAAAYLLSPYLPMIFMGEEYGETAPFLYFTSHENPDLIQKVREGRQAEFADCIECEALPDPQADETFHKSRLNHELINQPANALLFNWYKHLLSLRRDTPSLNDLRKDNQKISEPYPNVLMIQRATVIEETILILNFSKEPVKIALPNGTPYTVLANSAEKQWGGKAEASSTGIPLLQPESVVVLHHLITT